MSKESRSLSRMHASLDSEMSGCSVLHRRQLRRRAEDERATGGIPPPPKPWSPPELPPRGDGLKGAEERRESVVACRCKEWKLPEAPIGHVTHVIHMNMNMMH